MGQPKEKKAKNPIGKVTALGPQEPWQTALLLPSGWDDLTSPIEDFSRLGGIPDSAPIFVRGTLQPLAQPNFRGTPRQTITLTDNTGGLIRATFFGDTRGIGFQPGQTTAILGVMKRFDDSPWISSPELVLAEDVGQLRPKYPGKARVIRPERVRDVVTKWLPEAAVKAASFLDGELSRTTDTLGAMIACGLPAGVTIERLIHRAHQPKAIAQGEKAQSILEKLAALVRLAQAKEADLPERSRRLSVTPEMVATVVKELPFTLDDGQMAAVQKMVDLACGSRPMRHLISGDVGSGKTAVFATVAASVISAGGRVAILSPTAPLARQTLDVIFDWWPEIRSLLVTGDSKPPADVLQVYELIVGTTALLNQDLGVQDLVIVDEQQKYSVGQRTGLLRQGDEHLIEATATCIPRSMALIKYGAWTVSRLQGDHVKKTIETRIRDRLNDSGDVRKDLMAAIRDTVQAGGQVLVVYPTRDGSVDGPGMEGLSEEERSRRVQRQNVESASQMFESLFPGRIRSIDGGRTDEEKLSAIDALRNDQADILVATSVVEVGIDLPKLRRCVVIHPERMGLTSLHQIRGRVARAGGKGYFDLYLPSAVSENAQARLQALVDISDGFELTEKDMELRGIGDLSKSSERQSGSDDELLYGRPISLQALKDAAALFDRLPKPTKELFKDES